MTYYTITVDRQLTLFFAQGTSADQAERAARVARRHGHRNVTINTREKAPEQGGATAEHVAELLRL